MKSILFSKVWLFVFGFMAFFTACTDTDTSEAEVTSYTEETIYRIQESTNMGKFGCYELIFPVTLTFPDGSVSPEINSYEELANAVRSWRMENRRARILPMITLPFDVLTEDGELITIETREEMHRLRMECRRTYFENNGPMGHNGHGKFCFRLQFPLSIQYPDGTVVSYDDRRAMGMALKLWKRENRDSDVRPVLVFPLNVVLEDRTVVTVNSKEELKALKEDCN